MRPPRYFFAILALSVLALPFFVSCVPTSSYAQDTPEPQSTPKSEETMWTVDLTEIGFGIVGFASSEYAGRPGRGQNFTSGLHEKGGPEANACYIGYNPDLYGEPLREYGQFDDRFSFISHILNCALELEENSEHLKAWTGESGFTRIEHYFSWISAYEESCGTSYYRLGWRGEPETDTDLGCVPGLEEGVEELSP